MTSLAGTLYDDRVASDPDGGALYRGLETASVAASDTQSGVASIELKVDGSRTEEVFGFKFAPFETAVRQVADQYLELEAKA